MSATLTVDKGVAIPGIKAGICNEQRFPFNVMETGDSFLIRQNGGGKKWMNQERNYALQVARRFKIKATSRMVPGGIRVWRVK